MSDTDRTADVAHSDHLAAIDVGTNSFHLVVARIGTTASYEVVARRKETIRLGHGDGHGDMRRLTADAIDRGVAALARMRIVADTFGAAVRAVATSAVREADNADVFLDRARLEAGVDVEVISGLEEAHLIHLGILGALPMDGRSLLLVDIGGGSTELLLGLDGRSHAATSCPLGAVRLTDRYFPGGHVDAAAVDACRAHIRHLIGEFEPQVRRYGFDVAVASSGTAQTIAAMVATRREGELPPALHGYEVGTDELEAVVVELVEHSAPEDRASLPGLEPRRADIIVAGALVLHEVVRAFEIDRFVYSAAALREGILVDTLQRRTAPTGAADGDVSR